MTDNNLHVKLKPAVKVFLINEVLTCTGQNIFQVRHLNCWRHLEFNFRSPTPVTNISSENKVLAATLQDSASPNVFKFFQC